MHTQHALGRSHALALGFIFASSVLSACAGEEESPPSDHAVDGLLVTLDDGQVQGDMAGEARRFLKIPFAKPPVGALRWRAPESNDPWDGVRYETEFAEGCAQNADQGAPASTNEDCLYLNVWSPEPAPHDAPVMVWIHGGGNFSGAAGIPVPTTQQLWYDGKHLAARHGVVVVTLQYRLGPLGFAAHPGLADEGNAVGNQGLLDQRMALQWVNRNIARFGGDPDNVTIFGESAGSADVCYHVASPGSWGLFHRAIGQSGGCTIRATGAERTTASVASSMEAFGEALGCPAGSHQLACMRDASVETVMANAMQPRPGSGEVLAQQWTFAAVIDGPDGFLPDAPQALFDRGEIADVPYLLGSNNDEGTTFIWQAPSLDSQEAYEADMQLRFGDDAADILALYPASDFQGSFDLARERVMGDSGVVCSTHDTARRAAAAGRRVYLYNFNVAWSIAPTIFKAGHAAEISHAFGVPYVPTPDPDSEAVAEAMSAYWAQFARTGDPNHAAAPATWPAFTTDDDRRLQLSPDWPILNDFRNTECAYFRSRASGTN